MNTSRSSNEGRAWQPAFAGVQRGSSLLELEGWMPSEIGFISPMVEQLMRLIEAWRCVVGHEFAVELALREALNNAVVHSNAMDPDKLVEVHCRCERANGLRLIVKDHGKGFDPRAVSDPLASDRLELYGTPEPGTEHVWPGCSHSRRLQAGLKEIADWILPREKRPCIYEVEIDIQSLIYSRQRADRPDVRVTIQILHGDHWDQPIDECEERGLKDMEQALLELGACNGAWNMQERS